MDLPHLLLLAFALALFGCGAVSVSGPGRSGRGGSNARLPIRLLWTIAKWGFFLLVLALLILSIVAIPLAAIAAVVGVMAWVKRRAGQQYALLLTVAAAAERQMPLAPVLDAFAVENGGFVGHRARRAAGLLRAGCSLPQALEQVGGLVPRDAVATIRVGAETGSLAAAVREASESIQWIEPIWSSLSGKILYFCFLLMFIFSMLSFLMLKIAPAFQRIFYDFGTELPWITQTVFGMGPSSSFVVAVVALAMLMVVLFFYTLARYVGWSGFDLPGMGSLVRRFHTAPILQALALAADRGLPFRGGIATLAGGYPRRSIRWRLHSVVLDLDAGGDWAESLARHGLIARADRAVLQAAERVGNLGWALREVAAGSRRRLIYRVQGLLQLAFVVAIIGFGLVVLWFTAGYFLPLVTLIRELSWTV